MYYVKVPKTLSVRYLRLITKHDSEFDFINIMRTMDFSTTQCDKVVLDTHQIKGYMSGEFT